MNLILSVLLFIAGLALVVYFSEKLVKGAVASSLGFGVSSFLISVVFIGFDPENLGVGIAGTLGGSSGIALGSIIGSAMVAVALAFGMAALFSPMTFQKVPKEILGVPVLAVILLGLVSLDGLITRVDGGILLSAFFLSVGYLLWLNRRGIDIKAGGEVAEVLGKKEKLNKWRALGLLILSLAAIVIGSELVVDASRQIISRFHLSDTIFGMTVLAFLISIEELARELPAAMKGRPEISFGNVVGSILAFFLFNAGIIALVRPISVGPQTLTFYLPVTFATVVTLCALMLRRRLARWAGLILVLFYAVFFIGGFI